MKGADTSRTTSVNRGIWAVIVSSALWALTSQVVYLATSSSEISTHSVEGEIIRDIGNILDGLQGSRPRSEVSDEALTIRRKKWNRDGPPIKFNADEWINNTIRKWGCNRTETPTIFVHIGKAGGGMTRARFAAAALDYDREEWHSPHKDKHWYPVSSTAKAKFCNSRYRTWNVPNTTIWQESFEGNLPCNATTPIGLALACPEPAKETGRCLGCTDWGSDECHTVYVGHNNLGSELHWLPPPYVRKWWKSTPWDLSVDWSLIDPSRHGWCREGSRPKNIPRPVSHAAYKETFAECSIPTGDAWDGKFESFWLEKHQEADKHIPLNYSPIYASLPVQRLTMVREPWSWLVSKFFWHHDLDSSIRCDDMNEARNWAHEYALQYIAYLCGNDCAIRYEQGLISLDELWIQTESNLRHAFSVVGLMDETTTFYEMVSARVAYLNMSLNPHVQGKRHKAGRTRETKRCKRVFASTNFQEEMKREVPSLRVLHHLYEVAVEVNRFQLEELRECQHGPDGGSLKPSRDAGKAGS